MDVFHHHFHACAREEGLDGLDEGLDGPGGVQCFYNARFPTCAHTSLGDP